MNITLVLAADSRDPLVGSDPIMPLSLPLLAGADPNHDYTFVDMLKSERVDYSAPCDLAGISYRANSEKAAFAVADEFRSRGIPVALGGPQASSNPHEALTHADSVAIGEAESLWPVMVGDLAEGNNRDFYVSSICAFEAEGHSVYRDETPVTEIPPVRPRRSLFRKKYVFDTVFAMRGCHVGCDFCYVPRMYGRRYRMRPVDEVVDEIAQFKRYYYLLDDSVFGRPATFDYYLNLYDGITNRTKRHYWTGQANLDAASTEEGRRVIRAAAKSGMLYAAVGLESINPEVLKKNGAEKKMGLSDGVDPIDRMLENIRFIQDQGIVISGWFTIGYEDDSVETIRRTYAFCKEHNIIPVIFLVVPLKGTPLHDRLAEEGRLDHVLRTGVLTDSFTSEEAMEEFVRIYDDAYRFRERVRRIRFLDSRLKDASPGERIHKALFLWFLQKNLNKAMKVFPRYFIENRLMD